jgi:hypothetical protein
MEGNLNSLERGVVRPEDGFQVSSPELIYLTGSDREILDRLRQVFGVCPSAFQLPRGPRRVRGLFMEYPVIIAT